MSAADGMRELQIEHVAALTVDADRILTTALDISRMVSELSASLNTGNVDWELGAHMGMLQAQLLSLHVRYAAVMATRICEIRTRLEEQG